MKELTPWLEQKFPEYEFNFIQGFNTMDYYRDLLNRAEQLPDIITCRRFSLNDAAPLAEHLMDLSTTEVAGTFYSSYLNNNQEPDGALAAHVRRGGRHGCKCRSVCSVQHLPAHQLR